MSRRRRQVSAALSVGAMVAVAACSGGSSPADQEPTNTLEVISWWTAPSEKAALGVLFDAYRRAHGGVEVVEGAVAGGSGSNAQVVLATRLRDGNPPDVWQAFPGAALRALVSGGRVTDVSTVYQQTGLAAQMPEAVAAAVTVNGKQYAVPTSAHRQNVLWFNKAVLAKAGVKEPGAGYGQDAFVADLQKLKAAGVTPLCLGGKDAFTKAELFENVLLGTVGTDGWASIGGDRFNWSGPQVKSALGVFRQLLGNADPEAGGMTWDQAAQKLAQGGCGFDSMNDSAYGELLKVGAGDQTVGSVAFPGTEGNYLSVIDTFVLASGAKNAVNGMDFLKAVADPATQTAFSKEKGSVPIRRDASVSGLTAYQQGAAKDLREGTVLMSVTHGQLLSPAFQLGFYDAVSTFASGGDASAFNNTLVRAVNAGQARGY